MFWIPKQIAEVLASGTSQAYYLSAHQLISVLFMVLWNPTYLSV